MKTLAALPLVALLVGCADFVKTPSLLPRPIETRANTPPIEPTAVTPGPIDAALGRRIEALLADARSGDSAFTRAEREGGGAIAAGRGAAEGSERWLAAEQARSALSAARQISAAALSEIDSLLTEQVNQATGNAALGGVAELTAAQSEADAIVARQTARLDALRR